MLKNFLKKIDDILVSAQCHVPLVYFSIDELVHSDIAKSEGIDNKPTERQICNMKLLIINVLDPLRESYGKPIYVNSGFRSEALNKRVGGASFSHHLCNDGYAAADITTGTKKGNKEIFRLVKVLNLPYCQCIDESNFSWIHVSYHPKDVRREHFSLK